MTAVCFSLFTKTAPNEIETHAMSNPDPFTRLNNIVEHPSLKAVSLVHFSIPSSQHDCGKGGGQSLDEFNPQQ